MEDGRHDRPARARGAAAARCACIGTPERPGAARRGRRSCARGSARGGQRRDRDRDGVYEHADAIRIMDAWWPLLGAGASSSPRSASRAFDQLLGDRRRSTTRPTTTASTSARPTRAAGTATSRKDLRTRARRARSAGRYSRALLRRRRAASAAARRCAASLRGRARGARRRSSTAATRVQVPASGDQWCFDAVRFRAASAAPPSR